VGAAASVGDSVSGWCVPMWSRSASTSENPLGTEFAGRQMRDPYWGWHRIYSICYNKRVRSGWERGKAEIVHAAVRIYQLNPDKVDKFKQKKNEDFLLVIREVSGFRAYYALDAGAGRIASVGVFDDRAGAEESIKMATDTLRQNMARLAPNRPEVLEGEVYATEAASAGPLGGATDAVRGVTDRLLGGGEKRR
jgi:hypothetical protein